MRIGIISQVDPGALARLQVDHDVTVAYGTAQEGLGDVVAKCEVVVMRSGVQLDRRIIEGAPDLKLVIRAGSGFDNIDLEAARQNGVRVVRIPGPASRAVAELTLGLMLAASRNIVEADASMRRGEWRKSELAGNLLRSKVAGVVGLGNIGSVVAALCRAVEMTVVGCVANPNEFAVRRFAADGIDLRPLEEVVAAADYLTLHVPLDDSTYHMIDERMLGLMPDGSYLINTSRGGVVDEQALTTALDAPGGLAGAALDTHEAEGGGVPALAGHPKVVLTPHIGSMAIETQAEIGRRMVDIVNSFERGGIDELITEHERVA